MIPKYDEVTLPLLKILGDGRVWTAEEYRKSLVKAFSLTEAELSEMLPSGRTTTFSSRAHWAKTYLERAGLVTSPARGKVQITDSGKALLAEDITALSVKVMRERFEGIRAWESQSRSRSTEQSPSSAQPTLPTLSDDLSPEESLEQSFQRYRRAVQEELLAQVKSMSPAFFERLVVDLLLKLGYGGPFGQGLTTGRSGDGGIDGVIHQDKLGLDLLYVQAKRWEGSVGGPTIREFAGALSANRASKGVIITTSHFTRDAIVDAERMMASRIVLIDGVKLSELLYETGLGLVPEHTFEMKRIDAGYFSDD
jgi:restriction system protein